MRKGVRLIDGGVLNPVPIAPTFHDGTEMTIAVNLGGAVEADQGSGDWQPEPEEDPQPFYKKPGSFIKKRLKQKTASISQLDWGVYDVANQAFDAMQGSIARLKLAAYPPDHTVEIARNACGTLEFDRADEMIALGYKKAQEGLRIPE